MKSMSVCRHDCGSGPGARTYHKDVGCFRWLAADAEKLEEVPKLAVDITAYCDGAGHGLNVALLHEDASDHLAQCLDVGLWEVLALSKLFDPTVWIADSHGGRGAAESRG